MKQKIVINVPMHSEKAQSKAMKIAVAMQGVSSVSIGKENDQLEVTGEGVDSACLAISLRKKFCFADIRSVEIIKPPKPPPPTPIPPPPPPPKPIPLPSPPRNTEQSPPTCRPPSIWPPPCQPFYYECWPVYDAGPPSCSIL